MIGSVPEDADKVSAIGRIRNSECCGHHEQLVALGALVWQT